MLDLSFTVLYSSFIVLSFFHKVYITFMTGQGSHELMLTFTLHAFYSICHMLASCAVRVVKAKTLVTSFSRQSSQILCDLTGIIAGLKFKFIVAYLVL